MRKTHEVLRLHFDLKLKQRQIARSVNLSQSTVHEYLHRFTAAGLSWPLPEQTSEAELEAALFSADAKPPRAPARNLPDFSHIHKELQEHKHVTLQLLWEEYIATHPDGYRYSTNKYRPVNRSKASGNTVESPTLEVSFSCTRENDKNR